MFSVVVGTLNVVLVIVKLIIAFKSKDKFLSRVHSMYSLMFISYSVAAFNQNFLFWVPGLIIGLLAVFLSRKNED
ncbi:hypothetical protein [Anaerobacillus alkalidiazotrophicus]|nr:hypothetical protein [Anaerobacillus alkalidiazotrophicus]